ncbi:MAG TPA: glycogen synthase [Acidimicrobiales bacterium]|nr:glycogen synthase [Acidimicrobiales bacterium]
MRVALLTREYPPEVYGGAGVHVEQLADALAPLVDVAVHCFGAPRASALVERTYGPWAVLDAPDADPVTRTLGVLSVDLAMAAGIGDAQICHSHTWYANFAGHLAKLGRGTPHVVTTHSLEPLRPWKIEQLGGGYAISSFAERTALEGADRVIAVSHAMARDVLACYPAVDPARVEVIHNGVDAQLWRHDDATDALERYGVDPGRPYVLFVGRVTRQKGIAHLLEAAPLLDGRSQLVVCAGAADTAAIATEVDALARTARRRTGGLVWIDAMLPRPEVAQLLSHATCFVCPSIYEPFGLVNVEAMACGAPVVASAVGGIPEIVVDGETGLLVPVELDGGAERRPVHPATFAAGLAVAINALVDDPGRARAMGAAGRQRVEEMFAWPAIAARTVECYERALAR